MPYKSVSELPDSIKKLPIKAQNMFLKAFNESYKRNSEAVAFKVAWAIVKKNFKKVGEEWVAKGMGLSLFKFDLQVKSDVFIQKSKSGEYFLEATLSDTELDSQGKKFTESALKNYAEQINTYGVAGFITHADWDRFKVENSHLSKSEFIKKARTGRNGILKTIKAVYEKGKLWIKALIDKRYVNRVKQFNKVSIEALVPVENQVGNSYTGGYVLGFALDNNPVNTRADAYITDE